MDSILANRSKLGAFGEYLYANFAASHGFVVKRTNFCHTDFLLTSEAGVRVYVDVKTSDSRSGGYSGKREHPAIVYESILIIGDGVFLVPDEKSPFNSGGNIRLGSLDDLHDDWTEAYKSNLLRESCPMASQKFSAAAFKELFLLTRFKRVRVIQRGSASDSRWSGTIDNLPGSSSVIDSYDATVFVSYSCAFRDGTFLEDVRKLYFFDHLDFRRGVIPMLPSNSRQLKKGFSEHICLQSYSNAFPNYVFPDYEKFRAFVASLG